MSDIPVEIQDLVDNPREELHIELKAWMDLSDEVARAKIARHLAALANHGGGYLAFGFNDDGQPGTPHPGEMTPYNRDAITGIVDKYLVPAFQCDVFLACQTGGEEPYPVVRVPSHKSVPICSKKNGPHDPQNNPQGIRMGQHYIRVPGPKSIAIETPDQWRDLIHRCVINERESLLQSLGRLIRQPEVMDESGSSRLLDWHDKMHEKYMGLPDHSDQPWPVSIEGNHYQFSYQIIEGGEKTKHTIATLSEAIRVAGERVKNVVWTGWSMFYQFSRPEIAPHILVDDSMGEDVEVLEANLLSDTFISDTVPDFWRITVDGRTTIIRPYREDRVPVPHLQKSGLEPGMWLSPRTLIREIYELVTHAKELAKEFTYVESVQIQCTWYGLKDRRFADFEPSVSWHDRTCHADGRSTGGRFSVEQLTGNTTSVVVALAAPVLVLFGGWATTDDWVDGLRPGFRAL